MAPAIGAAAGRPGTKLMPSIPANLLRVSGLTPLVNISAGLKTPPILRKSLFPALATPAPR
eukprot:3358773-Lingulodinium_polyedra.AAC.1